MVLCIPCFGQAPSLGLPVEVSAGCGGCPIPIEKLMREFQARKAATDQDDPQKPPIQWPPAECGENRIPAPPYPPDGFYGNMLCDPRLMTELVSAVNTEMRAYGGYSNYIVTPNNEVPDLDGEETVPGQWRHSYSGLFAALDGSLGGYPTLSNYCEYADGLWDVVQQLQFVVVADSTNQSASRNGTHRVTVSGSGDGGDLTSGGSPFGAPEVICFESCGAGRAQWSAWLDAALNAQQDSQVAQLTEFRYIEKQLFTPNSCEDNQNPPQYTLCRWETLGLDWRTGTVAFNSGTQRGRSHLFMKFGAPPLTGGVSNRPPGGETYEDKFLHYGTIDSPANGTNAWARAVYGDPYGFTSDNGDPVNCHKGWQVNQTDPIVAVIEPYYIRLPDDAASASCSTCLPGKVSTTLGGVHVKISLGQHEGRSAGYLMVRGDTLVGWGDETVQPDGNGDPAPGNGAIEFRSARSISIHGQPSASQIYHPSTPYPHLRQVRGPRVFADLAYDSGALVVNLYWTSLQDTEDTLEPGRWIPAGDPFKTIVIGLAMTLEDDPDSGDPADLLSVGTLTVTESLLEPAVTKYVEKVAIRPDFEEVGDPYNRTGGDQSTPGTPIPIRPDFLPTSHGMGPRATKAIWELRRGVDSYNVAAQTERVLHTRGAGTHMEVRTLLDGAGQVAMKESRTFSVSATGDEQLVSHLAYTEGASYHQTDVDAADVSEGLFHTAVESVTGWGDSWRAYEYDESTGRVTKVVSQFLDNDDSVESNNRVTEFVYHDDVYLSHPNADTTPEFIVEKIEKLTGYVVGRTYTVYWLPLGDRETTTVRCASTQAPSNLAAFLNDAIGNPLAGADRVEHARVTHGGAHSGRVQSRQSADGTVSVFEYYELGVLNEQGHPLDGMEIMGTVVMSGPAATATTPVGGSLWPRDGTRSVTVRNSQGTMLMSKSWDMNGTVANGLYCLDYSLQVPISLSLTTEVDALGRVTETTYLDGRTSTSSYDCCHLTSETDTEGSETRYEYDSLKRVVRTLRQIPDGRWLATEVDYDGAGNLIEERRVPYSSPTTPGTPVIVTSQNEYDLSGQLVSSTDALGNVTHYEHELSGGFIVETTTLPDPDGTGDQLSPEIVTTYYPDGSTKSVGGTGARPVSYEYGVSTGSATYTYTKELRGSSGTQWTATHRDALGRQVFVERPGDTGSVWDSTAYDDRGNTRHDDADGVITLTFSGYGPEDKGLGWPTISGLWEGQWSMTVQDADLDGEVDFDGSDRISLSQTELAERVDSEGTYTVRRSSSFVWTTDGDDDDVDTAEVTETTVTGECAWHMADGQEIHTVISYGSSATKSIATTDAAGGVQVTTTEHGFQAVSLRWDPEANPAGTTTTAYDNHGRVIQTVLDFEDSRPDAVTDYTNDALDRVETQTDPEPNATSPYFGRRVTTTTYDDLGRVVEVESGMLATYTSYNSFGEVIEVSGSVNPVRYEYDSLGRLWKLKTYKDAPSTPWTGEAVTTWNYHSTKGTLTSKSYNSGGGPSYLYKPSGRVSRKTNQRNIQANYTYNAFGEVSFINYSDTTQDVTLTYDRVGRLKTVKDAAGLRTFTYDDAGQVLTESIASATGAGNLLSGVTVTNAYDTTTKLRTSHTTAKSSLSKTVNYGYDSWRRMDHVQKDTLHARFAYDDVTGQIVSTTYIHDDDDPTGNPHVLGERTHDQLGRLSLLEWTSANTSGAGDIAGFGYEHDADGRRIRMDLTADETYWDYEYDDLGQLASAEHVKDDGQAAVVIPGESSQYIYDDIGNRLAVYEGGGDGQSPYLATYTSNLLNQYTVRDVPGNVEVVGRTSLGSVEDVYVNTQEAWLNGRIFAKRITFNNADDPVVGEIAVEEFAAGPVHVRTSWWDVFLPEDPESFSYDADGNLTLDGIWHYEWDAENRLKSMQMRDDVATVILNGTGQNPDPWVRIEFAYDWMGRRIMKYYQTSTDDPATHGGKYGPPITWKEVKNLRYVYDGWMLSMSYKASGSSLEDQSFAWGPDLSSGMGGAGGIGGLVAYTDDEHDALNPGSSDPDFLGPMFPIYDGSGNIVKMIRFESLGGSPTEIFEASEAASYEYGPFGENRSTTGELGSPGTGGTHQGLRNPFRFSTKYTDAETGLLYYGYRYYSPTIGRWINRDPIEEKGGSNLLTFVKNDPTNQLDALGQYSLDFHYYVVYYLFRLKCYPDSKAKAVAWRSQSVDDDELTNPLRHGVQARIADLTGIHAIIPLDHNLSILRDYHFWGSSQHKSTKANPSSLRSKIQYALSRNRLVSAGRWLHTYADSWSHDGFTAHANEHINRRDHRRFRLLPNLGEVAGYIGHADAAEGGHAPDNPYNDTDKALRASYNIYRLIPEYGEKDRDCNCTEVSWNEIGNELYRMFSYRNESELQRSLFNASIIRERFGSEISGYDLTGKK